MLLLPLSQSHYTQNALVGASQSWLLSYTTTTTRSSNNNYSAITTSISIPLPPKRRSWARPNPDPSPTLLPPRAAAIITTVLLLPLSQYHYPQKGILDSAGSQTRAIMYRVPSWTHHQFAMTNLSQLHNNSLILAQSLSAIRKVDMWNINTDPTNNKAMKGKVAIRLESVSPASTESGRERV